MFRLCKLGSRKSPDCVNGPLTNSPGVGFGGFGECVGVTIA